MNGEIQSAERDEVIYHEALVHPAMHHTSLPPRRVLILGGGEGATAREVLKWHSVERVDMYEWDEEVTTRFRSHYPLWGRGAWEDPRLVLHHEDVFVAFRQGVYPPVPYDVILMDLFEPSEALWVLFSRLASEWLSEGGALGMYAGIRDPERDIHPAEEWLAEERIRVAEEIHGIHLPNVLSHRDVYSYKVFVPSFSGEAMFLLACPSHLENRSWTSVSTSSGLTTEVWRSYMTWNRYPVREGTEGVFHGV